MITAPALSGGSEPAPSRNSKAVSDTICCVADIPLGTITTNALDDQHEQLFRLFEKITSSKSDPIALLSLLRQLWDALILHFKCEERFMEIIGYSKLLGHKWQHQHLTKRLQDIIEIAELSRDTGMSPTQIAELRRIVIDHQAETDADYIRFYEQCRED